MHAAGDDFRHVPVLIGYGEDGSASSPFFIDLLFNPAERFFACLKFFCIMVADDIAYDRTSHISVHIGKMVETFAAVRVPGSLICGQQGVDLHCHESGVYHDVFGRTGVDIYARDLKFRLCRVEVLVLDLPFRVAVKCVRKVSIECFYIKMGGAHADLLVRGKSDGNRAVGDIFVKDTLHHGHNLRDARLIVRAEDCGAVACDQGTAFEFPEMGEHIRREDAPARAEGKVSAIVILVDLRDDPAAAEFGYRVQMRDEAESGTVLVSRRGRDVGVQIALGVDLNVCDSHRKKLA